MKIKNIFFAAILVFAGFSCSMEDDTIMNDVEKGIEEATEAYTVLDFGVAFNEMATKVGKTGVESSEDLEASEAERHMSDVSIFLYEEGKLIEILKADDLNITLVAAASSETTDNNPLENLKFVTKYKEGRTLTAHVVVNGGKFLQDIPFGTSVTELNKTVSGCLSAKELIKYGTKKIVFGTDVINHSVSPSEAEQNPNIILVTVSQIAARLDFSQFSVTLDGFEKTPVVTLEEAKFVNLQQDGKIVEGYVKSNVAVGSSLDCNNNEGDNSIVWTDMGTAYGYANQYKQDSEMNTALYVKFTVDGRTFEKTYPINPAGITKEVDHNGIKGGYLYDIKVRWTITPKWGDSTIEFYTRDWVHNTIPEVVL
ncbi:hypothetical protein [Bacteroides sp.]|uniref:hypothetical protein n=1 Tax=Bacteroides sp. TaxID=29523 RepID=UPI003A870B54